MHQALRSSSVLTHKATAAGAVQFIDLSAFVGDSVNRFPLLTTSQQMVQNQTG